MNSYPSSQPAFPQYVDSASSQLNDNSGGEVGVAQIKPPLNYQVHQFQSSAYPTQSFQSSMPTGYNIPESQSMQPHQYENPSSSSVPIGSPYYSYNYNYNCFVGENHSQLQKSQIPLSASYFSPDGVGSSLNYNFIPNTPAASLPAQDQPCTTTDYITSPQSMGTTNYPVNYGAYQPANPVNISYSQQPQFTSVFSPTLVKDQELAYRKQLIEAVGTHLFKVTYKNDKNPVAQPITRFDSQSVPKYTIQSYLYNVLKNSPSSNDSLLAAVIYMERICAKHRLTLTSLNIHRFFLNGIMIASKFLDDSFYNNAFYARVGGISLGEINVLEVDFLFLLNFKTIVNREEVDRYRDILFKSNYQQPQQCR